MTPDLLSAYQKADESNEMKLRVALAIKIDPQKDDEEQIEQIKKLKSAHDVGRLRVTSAKIFVDGVIEAKTAALLEPYLSTGPSASPDEKSGELNFEPERLASLVRKLEGAGIQPHFHAIGDKAVRVALDAIEKNRHDGGDCFNSTRPHLAHLELVSAEDLPRFEHLDATATIQGVWAQRDSYIVSLTEPLLGPERSSNIYPFGSLFQAGARLAGGSDWPVTTMNPLDAIEVAVTRRKEGSKKRDSWLPHQRLALPTCLSAYTINGAFVNGEEKNTGSLEPGKAADLIVIDKDLFEVEESQIHSAKVVLTMINGEVVFEREKGDLLLRKTLTSTSTP